MKRPVRFPLKTASAGRWLSGRPPRQLTLFLQWSGPDRLMLCESKKPWSSISPPVLDEPRVYQSRP